MSDETPQLGLPLILPAQAQKHVTHNEGLALLDALVQPAVITFATNAPPATPAEGDRHVVGSAPTGLWAGQPGKLAVYEAGLWRFLTPKEGWTVQIPAQQTAAVYEGGDWRLPASRPMSASQLGVGTTADAFNALSVAGPATLLSHAGTGGHQVKINKADAGSTASVLFQTAFSGRAELGTMGSDNFSIKVSADGTTFREGLRMAATTGVVALPLGVTLPDGTAAAPALSFDSDGDTGLSRTGPDQLVLSAGGVSRLRLSPSSAQIDVPVTGTAVTQSATDTTAGRLVKTGDFGLGQSAGPPLIPTDGSAIGAGFYRSSTSDDNVYQTQVALTRMGWSSARQVEFGGVVTGGIIRFLGRTQVANNIWGGIVEFFHQQSILGTVSQTAGVPTGQLIEQGTNANGVYRRFACGLQVCWRDNLSAANVSTANGSLFRSASVTWTFPATFIAAPVVAGQSDSADIWMTGALPTTTTVALRLHSATTVAGATAFRAVATGRWF